MYFRTARPRPAGDVMFRVQSQPCATRIYRKDNPLDLQRLEDAVRDRYVGFKGHRVCHHSGDACCRGFWNAHKDEFPMGQIAQRLGMVEFVSDDTRPTPPRSADNDRQHGINAYQRCNWHLHRGNNGERRKSWAFYRQHDRLGIADNGMGRLMTSTKDVRERIARAIYDAFNYARPTQKPCPFEQIDEDKRAALDDAADRIMSSALTLSDHIAAVGAAGYRVSKPRAEAAAEPAELPRLGAREISALDELRRYRDQGRRHCWRVASMKKLAAHGLVEFESGSTQYRNITDTGRAMLAARPRDVV